MKIELKVGSRFKCNKGNINIISAMLDDRIMYKFFDGSRWVFKTGDRDVIEKLIECHVYRWC